MTRPVKWWVRPKPRSLAYLFDTRFWSRAKSDVIPEALEKVPDDLTYHNNKRLCLNLSRPNCPEHFGTEGCNESWKKYAKRMFLHQQHPIIDNCVLHQYSLFFRYTEVLSVFEILDTQQNGNTMQRALRCAVWMEMGEDNYPKAGEERREQSKSVTIYI